MKQVMQNNVVELVLSSAENKQMIMKVQTPAGKVIHVPAFCCSDGTVRVRYASPEIGVHSYTVCAGDTDAAVEDGSINVVRYEGTNPLYVHGPLSRAQNPKYMQHIDGEPFFYLADTWWMAMTERISFEEFIGLADDRQRKGFSAVQIIAGLYPDMPPFDVRGKNEGGFPWDERFEKLNPAFFEAADQKIEALIERGIMPCIVACWGYFAGIAGVDVLKRHWDHIIARWGAYPVMWCAAGEATMPFYTEESFESSDQAVRDAYNAKSRAQWTDITQHIRQSDPFERLLTIHPTQNGHEQVDNEALLDLDMLQTGHGSYMSLVPTLKQVHAALERRKMPVINSEVCYEGICETCGPDIQRYLFASNVLMGCCGHTYGANGIWQINDAKKPYGPSPHGVQWGIRSWQDAANLPGSTHIGNMKRFLCKFDWHRFEFRQDWLEYPCSLEGLDGLFAAGIPREIRVIFNPTFGGYFWGEFVVKDIEPDVQYEAFLFDIICDEVIAVGDITPVEGRWVSPRIPKFQDWLVVMKAK